MAKKIEKKEYGIKETQDALQLIFAIGKAIMDSKKDGFNTADISNLMTVIPYVTPAFDGATEIPAEMKDLSSEEIKTLLTFSANHLGSLAGADEKLALQLEKGLAAALAIIEFVKVI